MQSTLLSITSKKRILCISIYIYISYEYDSYEYDGTFDITVCSTVYSTVYSTVFYLLYRNTFTWVSGAKETRKNKRNMVTVTLV